MAYHWEAHQARQQALRQTSNVDEAPVPASAPSPHLKVCSEGAARPMARPDTTIEPGFGTPSLITGPHGMPFGYDGRGLSMRRGFRCSRLLVASPRTQPSLCNPTLSTANARCFLFQRLVSSSTDEILGAH
jgi:hypothetical protein